MAQLKELIVTGTTQLLNKTYTKGLQITELDALTSATSTSYGPGTSGQILKSNGTNAYWADEPDNNGVTNVNYNTTSKAITKTINGTTSNVITISTLKSDLAFTKSDIGLSNVENTALSTWTGNTSITSIGTLTTGTIPWNLITNKPGNASTSTAGLVILSNEKAANLGTSAIGTSTAAARADHVHAKPTYGNITTSGAIGTTANYAIYTTTSGVLVAGSLASNSPNASGNATAFIDSISQDSKGKITATKKTIPAASTTTAGIVQLSTAIDSTATDQAATPSAIKALADQIAGISNTTYTAASTVTAISTTPAVGTSTAYARADHKHNISLSSGDANGQIKIAGTNVSVRGLNTAAYEPATNFLKWQTTSAASTELFNYGVYINNNKANGTGPSGGDYYSILNIPYDNPTGNESVRYTWQLGTNIGASRLWYRAGSSAAWGEWQTIAHAPQSTTSVGDATHPVYMTNTGKITATTYELNTSVPADAQFTDTTYTFSNGTDGTFSVTPNGGTAQTISLGFHITSTAPTSSSADGIYFIV